MQFIENNLNIDKTMQSCKHETLNVFGSFQNCQKCGVYIPKNKEIKCYKSCSLNSECYLDFHQHYKALCSKDLSVLKITPSLFGDVYISKREELILFITEIGQKLNYQLSTIHLAVLYMDIINSKIQFPDAALKVYAVTCSMLAGKLYPRFVNILLAKAIELDERIPFISKLRKNSSLTYRSSDIKKAERHIISLLEWKLQIPTLYELLQNYLSIGILFSNDKLSSISKDENFLKPIENQFQKLKITEKKGQKQLLTDENSLNDLKTPEIQEIAQKINKEAMRLTNMIIRDQTFIQFEKKTLALACVCFLRKSMGIQNNWNNELQELSFGLQYTEVESILQTLVSKFEKFFKPIEKLQNNQFTRQSPTGKLNSKVFNQIRLNNLPNSQFKQQNYFFNLEM